MRGALERWLSGTTMVGREGFSGLGVAGRKGGVWGRGVERGGGRPLEKGSFSTLTDWRKKGERSPRA